MRIMQRQRYWDISSYLGWNDNPSYWLKDWFFIWEALERAYKAVRKNEEAEADSAQSKKLMQ